MLKQFIRKLRTNPNRIFLNEVILEINNGCEKKMETSPNVSILK